MIYLWATALIWAFSFALVGKKLAQTDAAFVAWARMTLALLLFAVLCRPKGITPPLAARLAGIGAVQYGLMFLFYLAAFQTLKAYEVALFTITTPFWVVLFSGQRKQALNPVFWGAATLSVAGAWLLQPERAFQDGLLRGFLLVQAADICFAWGQTAYKRLRHKHIFLVDHCIYAFVYLGAFLCTLAVLAVWGDWGQAARLDDKQWGVLLWLGFVASGLGLFLWNKGAVRVNPGSLAAANNLKIPLTIAVCWLCFGEFPKQMSLWQFAGGLALILAAMGLPVLRKTAPKTVPKIS